MTETDLPPAPLATFGFIAVGAVLLAAAGVFVATNRWSSGGGGLSAPALQSVDAGEVEALRAIQALTPSIWPFQTLHHLREASRLSMLKWRQPAV